MTDRRGLFFEAVSFAECQVRAGIDWQQTQHDILNLDKFANLFSNDLDENGDLTMEIIRKAEDRVANEEPHEDTPCLDAPWWAAA